jgi:dCTP deaminase
LTFWSGKKIATKFAAPADIVTPYDQTRIDCSAYTLTLGEQYFITPDHDMKMRDSVRKTLAEGGPVSIPAGQFAFLQTEESLNMPDSVMGFISMKAGYKFKGLINVSGFHVDPGFRGKLVFAVHNAGPSTVTLHRGDRLFLLWLADLDLDTANSDLDEVAITQYSRKAKPPMLEIGNDIINGVNQPIHSLQNLSKKIDDLENSIKLIRNSAGVAVIVIGLALSAFKSWPTTDDTTSNLQSAKQATSEEITKASPTTTPK